MPTVYGLIGQANRREGKAGTVSDSETTQREDHNDPIANSTQAL